jgi:chromosome segregation ATPase
MSSWTRLFLGDLGQHLDIEETRDEVDALRRRLHRRANDERHQDQRIAELEADVDELRVIVAELTRLLVRGGSLTEDAVSRLVAALEEAQQPAGSDAPTPAAERPQQPRRFR